MADYRSASLIEILKKGRIREFSKKELIQSSDIEQKMCLIMNGYVKSFQITNEGSISIASIYGPGAFFPFSLVYSLLLDYEVYKGNETFYYEAMTNAKIYTLESNKLKQEVLDNQDLYKDLLFVAGRRFKWNIHRLENIGLHDSYHRVAHQLLFFCKNFGIEETRGYRIKIPMTQQDLADSLNITRETASVAISKLRKNGYIKTGRYIRVLDIKRLEDLAYG